MDRSCQDYCLTENERIAFERDGFFVVQNAMDPDRVDRLTRSVDRLDGLFRARIAAGDEDLEDVMVRPGRMASHDPFQLINVFRHDAVFLELVDLPQILPKVWGILGWNIKLYATQMVTTPQVPAEDTRKIIDKWHRDSGRLNIELETTPQPRVSLKVGVFLTDAVTDDAGNLYVIRGSHLKMKWSFPRTAHFPRMRLQSGLKPAQP